MATLIVSIRAACARGISVVIDKMSSARYAGESKDHEKHGAEDVHLDGCNCGWGLWEGKENGRCWYGQPKRELYNSCIVT